MTTTPYPRSQHWTADGFRVSVLLYLSAREPCATCGARPGRHSVWADRKSDGFAGRTAHFCDAHRPAKGTLPPLVYTRTLWTGEVTITEDLSPRAEWPCGECGQPSTTRYETSCQDCDDPAHVREGTVRVITLHGEQVRHERHHSAHVTAQWFRCNLHQAGAA